MRRNQSFPIPVHRSWPELLHSLPCSIAEKHQPWLSSSQSRCTGINTRPVLLFVLLLPNGNQSEKWVYELRTKRSLAPILKELSSSEGALQYCQSRKRAWMCSCYSQKSGMQQTLSRCRQINMQTHIHTWSKYPANIHPNPVANYLTHIAFCLPSA